MKLVPVAFVAGALALATVVLASVAFAQSTSAPLPAAAPPPGVTIPAGPSAAAAPAPTGKKLACQTASQAMNGQAKKDQMQLCVMQARLDCLKQAIDQNIVGPQRKEFVRSCVG